MEVDAIVITQKHEEHLKKYRSARTFDFVPTYLICIMMFSAELQKRREMGTVFRKRDRGSGQHIEDKEEKLKYSIVLKSTKIPTSLMYVNDTIYLLLFRSS